MIFVRLLRRWRPVGHDQRSARTKRHIVVIARVSEAIQFGLHPTLDCFVAFTLAMTEKEAERRKAQFHTVRTLRCGRAPAGAHASRRSTAVLAQGTAHPEGSAQARLRGRQRHMRRVAPASAAPTSSDAPRAPVIVPAGMMPEPPECEGDEPNARGHRTRSANWRHRPASFTRARFAAASNLIGDNSQWKCDGIVYLTLRRSAHGRYGLRASLRCAEPRRARPRHSGGILRGSALRAEHLRMRRSSFSLSRPARKAGPWLRMVAPFVIIRLLFSPDR